MRRYAVPQASPEQTIADLTRLLDVSRQLGATVELDPLLQAIEQAALEVLDCERASVFLHDQSRRELFSTVATGVHEIRFPDDRGIAGEAAQQRTVINVPDAYADARFNPDIDVATGFRTRSILTLPMVGHDGELMGVLQLLNKKVGSFDANDEHLAHTLGALAGVALQRQLLLEAYAEKRKLERDLNLARTIQQGVLPDEAPSIPGFEIAGWNRPADQTGGDVYDFIELIEGQLGLIVGDATGHGIGPALVAVECRALIRALALSTADLSHILGTTNRLLEQDMRDSRFVTLCLGFIDIATATLRFASAGHGPLLYYRAARDQFEELEVSGPPLGLFGGMTYDPPPAVQMATGDMLVLLTDGFYEYAREGDEQFGVDRVKQVLHAHRAEPCRAMIDRLYEAVQAFAAGAPQMDDMTVVIVKKTPVPTPSRPVA